MSILVLCRSEIDMHEMSCQESEKLSAFSGKDVKEARLVASEPEPEPVRDGLDDVVCSTHTGAADSSAAPLVWDILNWPLHATATAVGSVACAAWNLAPQLGLDVSLPSDGMHLSLESGTRSDAASVQSFGIPIRSFGTPAMVAGDSRTEDRLPALPGAQKIWRDVGDDNVTMEWCQDDLEHHILHCLVRGNWQPVGADCGFAVTGGIYGCVKQGRAMKPQSSHADASRLIVHAGESRSGKPVIYLQSAATRRYILRVKGVLCERSQLQGRRGSWERLELQPVCRDDMFCFHLRKPDCSSLMSLEEDSFCLSFSNGCDSIDAAPAVFAFQNAEAGAFWHHLTQDAASDAHDFVDDGASAGTLEDERIFSEDLLVFLQYQREVFGRQGPHLENLARQPQVLEREVIQTLIQPPAAQFQSPILDDAAFEHDVALMFKKNEDDDAFRYSSNVTTPSNPPTPSVAEQMAALHASIASQVAQQGKQLHEAVLEFVGTPRGAPPARPPVPVPTPAATGSAEEE